MARKRPYPENILHDLKLDGWSEDQLDFSRLTERENVVIRMYYKENTLTRQEIAEKCEITELRLRQILSRALRKIRKYSDGTVVARQ